MWAIVIDTPTASTARHRCDAAAMHPWLWAALPTIMALVQEMPEEGEAQKLSAKKFRKSYARKGLPVVMRGT